MPCLVCFPIQNKSALFTTKDPFQRVWKTPNLHHKMTANKGQNGQDKAFKTKFPTLMFHQSKWMCFCTNKKLVSIVMICLFAPHLSSFLTRLPIISKIDHTLRMFWSLHPPLLPLVRRNAQHCDRTHRANSLCLFPFKCCICFLGCTSVPGPWLVSRLDLSRWITGKIAPLSSLLGAEMTNAFSCRASGSNQFISLLTIAQRVNKERVISCSPFCRMQLTRCLRISHITHDLNWHLKISYIALMSSDIWLHRANVIAAHG